MKSDFEIHIVHYIDSMIEAWLNPLYFVFTEQKDYIEKNAFNDHLNDFIPSLMKSFGRLQQVTAFIAAKGLADPDEGAGPATDFFKLFALTAIAYIWTRYAEISFKKQYDDPKGFYKGI